MDLQPDAVARAVDEAVAVASGVDHVAGELVGLVRRQAGLQAGDHGVVGGADDLERLADLAVLALGQVDARDVGVVAGDAAAEVAQQRLGGIERRVAGHVVGERAVGAGGDDVVVVGVGARLEEADRQPQRELALA